MESPPGNLTGSDLRLDDCVCQPVQGQVQVVACFSQCIHPRMQLLRQFHPSPMSHMSLGCHSPHIHHWVVRSSQKNPRQPSLAPVCACASLCCKLLGPTHTLSGAHPCVLWLSSTQPAPNPGLHVCNTCLPGCLPTPVLVHITNRYSLAGRVPTVHL